MISETTGPRPISPQEIKPPPSDGAAEPEAAGTAGAEDAHADVREHLEPLSASGALLGFAVCDGDGAVLANETFLSHEGAEKAAQIFISSCRQMAESGRGVYRVTVEMDDVIVIYHCIAQGQGMFVLSSDCDLDTAAAKIAELAG